MWPYSLKRQQRPLATHTGPAAATAASTSWYNSSTWRRSASDIPRIPFIPARMALSFAGAWVKKFRSLTRTLPHQEEGKCLLVLKPDDLQASRNFFFGNQLPLSRAGTDFAGTLPGFRREDIAFPERPGPALRRPHFVNGAALLVVVENAIAIALLAQGPAARGPARV